MLDQDYLLPDADAMDQEHCLSDFRLEDHLDLLDYLEIDQCHLVGGCIGGAFSFNFLRRSPERVAAAVIQQSIGFDDNRQALYEMFDGWADDQKPARPALTSAILSSFRSNLYDHDFVLRMIFQAISYYNRNCM